MKVMADIFAFIEPDKLCDLLEKNPELKRYVESEIDRMKDEGIIKSCGCGGGCGSGGCGCGHHKKPSYNTPELTTALLSIFNYYIPDAIKDAVNMAASGYMEE